MPDDPLAVPGPGAADPAAAAARGDATGDPDGGGGDPYAWEADLYDVTTTGVSEQDVPFSTALAADAGGPVLELGCGTGRVLAPCAAVAGGGAGVDSSPAMLERARRRLAAAGLADRVELHLGDMRTVRLGRRFPLVTIPFPLDVPPPRRRRMAGGAGHGPGRTWGRAAASPATSSCPTPRS
jgi:SAM-dependent methyltransferase